MVPPLAIQQTIENFLELISTSRSANTTRSYKNALNHFALILDSHGMNIEETPISHLTENEMADFINALREYAPATEQMYLTAVSRFYQYIAAEDLARINLQRIQLLIQTRARKAGKRLPQFPQEDIEKVIAYAQTLPAKPTADANEKLRNCRDAAFILTLADSGIRVHEACNLRRGDIDWHEQKAIIIGKGDQEAILRFSQRTIRSLKGYLSLRAELDGASGRALRSLPIFARHDKGAGKKVKPITTTTGRNIISQHVQAALGKEAVGTITPHSFRHYFVTTVLRSSGGNLKLAQNLARHKNIQVTQRYAHLSDDELDRNYHEIFNPDKT
jgi:site-specific recombinase XerD